MDSGLTTAIYGSKKCNSATSGDTFWGIAILNGNKNPASPQMLETLYDGFLKLGYP